MAGLNVLDIINEPIAAALSYGMQAGGQNKEEIILVYDLGGGTFDVSVIQVGKDGVKILVTGGKNDLGGKNWDDRLITYLAAKFEEENGVNPLTDPFAHQEMRTKGETAKKSLTSQEQGPLHVRLRGLQVAARARAREVRGDHRRPARPDHPGHPRDPRRACRRRPGAGRSTASSSWAGRAGCRWSRPRVDREFGVESEKYDPDECVAKGAALWGVKRKIDGIAEQAGYDIRTGEGNKKEFDKQLEQGARGGQEPQRLQGPDDAGQDVGERLVPHLRHQGLRRRRGDRRAAADAEHRDPVHLRVEDGQFGTAVANQATIELVLMEAEGESLDPAFCKEIGRGTVELPAGVPRTRRSRSTSTTGGRHDQAPGREVSSNRECEVKLIRAGVMDVAEVAQAGSKLSVLTAR